jgi:hypothetical protein
MMPKAVEGLDKKKIDDLYANTFDLETVFPVKSYEELKTMLDEHFFCTSESDRAITSTLKKATKEPVQEAVDSTEVLEDDTVKKLLAGLDETN